MWTRPFEITGENGPALQHFYGGLFDWQIQDAGDGADYGVVKAIDIGIGGGIAASQRGGAPSDLLRRG